MPAWTCLIRPFYDRLDVTVPFLFYRVPDTNPVGPETVFTDRFWDDREHWVPPGVGVVPNSMRPYFGQIPNAEVGPMEGDPNAWIAGFSYADWIAGRLGGTCWPIQPGIVKAKVNQRQRVAMLNTYSAPLWQKQQIGAFPFVAGSIDQVQTVQGPLARAGIDQVQTVQGPLARAGLDQVQTVSTPTTPDGSVCANLATTPFAHYLIGVSGVTNGTCLTCGVLNRVWPLTQTAACVWTSPNLSFCGFSPCVWQLTVGSGGNAQLRLRRLSGLPAFFAQWNFAPWDGISITWLTNTFADTTCTWPNVVSLVPST